MAQTIEVLTTLEEVRKAVEDFIQNTEQTEERSKATEWGNGRIQFYYGTFDKDVRYCTINWDPTKLETRQVTRCINLSIRELVPDVYGFQTEPYYHGA